MSVDPEAIASSIRNPVLRVFLDETVLYMAARSRDARALRFWKLDGVELCTSDEELPVARFNLETDAQRRRFSKLTEGILKFKSVTRKLPKSTRIWKRDIPTLLAAIEARANYLVTFDYGFAARCSRKKIEGVRVISPAPFPPFKEDKRITPSVTSRPFSSRTASPRRSPRRRGG
jgi:predicted nucleic acid-binding protein